MSEPVNDGTPTAAPAASTAPPSVSRFAWLFGIAAGLAIAGGGLYAVSQAELHRLFGFFLEMAVVGLALLTTTSIWRWSAAALDTGSAEPDR